MHPIIHSLIEVYVVENSIVDKHGDAMARHRRPNGVTGSYENREPLEFVSCGYLQVTYDFSNFWQVTKGSAVVLSYMFLGGGSGPGPRSAPGH